jgi:hypothetical protein
MMFHFRITESRWGKMPTTSVRRRISSFSLSCGLLDQIWRQVRLRERAERQNGGAGGLKHLGRGREPLVELLGHASELSVHRGGI